MLPRNQLGSLRIARVREWHFHVDEYCDNLVLTSLPAICSRYCDVMSSTGTFFAASFSFVGEIATS